MTTQSGSFVKDVAQHLDICANPGACSPEVYQEARTAAEAMTQELLRLVQNQAK